MIFRDFLREQIDNLMTGDGRDGLAEGRRGTHVEVTFSAFEPLFSHIFTDLLQLNELNRLAATCSQLAAGR